MATRPAGLDALGVGWLADLLLIVAEQVAAAAWPRETLSTRRRAGPSTGATPRDKTRRRAGPFAPHTDDSEVTVKNDRANHRGRRPAGRRARPAGGRRRRDHAGFRVAAFTWAGGPRRRLLEGEEGCSSGAGDERRAVTRLPVLLDEPARWGDARDCVCGDAWNS